MPHSLRTIAIAALLGTPASAFGQLRLIPQPREITAAGITPLREGIAIDLPANAEDRFAATDLAAALRDRGIAVHTGAGARGSAHVSFVRTGSATGRRLLATHGLDFDSAMHDEGYAIVVDGSTPAHLSILAATSAGVFYGAQTVKQLVEGDCAPAAGRCVAVLHRARVRDWPAMRYRGLHDDLSRGPVPTLEFQKKQIRTFAAYKINVYSPYFEHTLEYRGNPLAAPPGGAMSPADVRALVAYARQYHIEVIPEQEAFGHLHHLLKYELYAPLAETPHGHVLAPGQPGSMTLIREMFAEIDSLFPGRFVHLGADETFELGRGQTQASVQQEGLGAVYLGFLKNIEQALRADVATRDGAAAAARERFLFWGDIAQNSPELVKTLPKDMIAVAWEYGPARSFDRLITPFVQAGLETWVAPGVNNWNRVYPNYANALANIQGFVRDGQRLGATGELNTTWDDDGESLFNQTWYGVLFGAAAGWQPGESSIEDFQSSFGRVFHGDSTGRIDEAQRKLIAAHTLLQKQGAGDASDLLFWLDPYSPEGVLMADRIRPVLHDLRVLAESAMVLVDQARSAQPALREPEALDALELGARRMDFIGMKFQFADEMAQMYARAAGADTSREGRSDAGRQLSDIAGVNGRAQDLRDGFTLIRDLYQQAWLRENRPYWLGNVLARYDVATQRWIDRIDRVAQARREWSRTRRLPPADSAGLRAPAPGLASSSTP
ncbi:MAG TPA: family 20 glycosylhydrolase [Gemmatimonadaceae bacterium]|nr:family 20 glycosylhydrolase [Gemmatimonadaceae bacterium]